MALSYINIGNIYYYQSNYNSALEYYFKSLNIPVRLAEGGVFFTFLLVFEFLLVLTDPYIEQYTGGEPAYKLMVNAGLAGLIFPLHSFAETQVKRRLFTTKKEIIKKRQKTFET